MSCRIIRGFPAANLSPVYTPSKPGAPIRSLPRNGELSGAPHDASTLTPNGESIEDLTSRAFERGVEEGRRSAADEFASAQVALSEQIAQAAACLARERPRLRRDAEADVVKLALAIARRVVHRELSLDPHAIQGLVRVAIDRMNTRDIVRIRTHPAHADAVSQTLIAAHLVSQVDLKTDGSLSLGDLVFETAQGELDASIDSQLKEIDLGIADRLGR
jgi:flagellar assembly protein FliH